MIDHLLRRLTVGQRIIGGFLVLVLLLALAIPVIITNHGFIVSRLQHVTNIETYADRLLLLALARIMSSRLNLLRYLQDYLPSSWESQNDANQATDLLIEAQHLITVPDQKAAVASVLEELMNYKTLVSDVQAARRQGKSQEAIRLVFLASKTGNNIGQQIEHIVKDSKVHVTATNKTIYSEAQRRLMLIVVGYASVLILSLIFFRLVARSITRPVSELWTGTEAFRLGCLDSVIPVTGTDELSLLARTFNQMAEQLQESFAILEQREQLLSEERNLLRTLLDNLPDQIFVKDVESRFLLANNAVARVMGVTTPDELVGKTDFDFPYPLGMAEQYYADEQAVIESGQPLGNREEPNVDRETGATIWFLTNKIPFRDSQNNIVGIVGIAHDITERKQMEEELRRHRERLEELVKERTTELTTANEQLRQEITERNRAEKALREGEERFALAVQGSNDGIWDWDIQHNSLYWSPRLKEFLRYADDELDIDFETFESLLHPEDREYTRAAIATYLKDRGLYEVEQRMRTKSGEYRWFRARGQALWDEAGNPVRMVGFTTDITERKQAEKELQQAKETAEAASLAKSKFLAHMSHELRTPLNGVLGYAQILQRDKSLTEHQKEAVEIMYRSGEHLLTMINDILDLSRIEAGKMELEATDFYLPEFVKAVVEIAQVHAQQKGISLDYELVSELHMGVHGDETRLRQVLLNLLSNAIKFTDHGKVILRVMKLETRNLKLETCVSQSTLDNRHSTISKVRFQVEDTGIGIPSDRLSEIFKPFQQVKDMQIRTKGLGLGLAISQRFVRLMGSKLHVQSSVGKGSTFWFDVELPEVSGVVASTAKSSRNIIGFRGSPCKILIADDEPENLAVLKEMLLPLGFEIVEAVHGRDALDKAAEFHPDLILMDLVMPEMDGFEATRRIRELETGNLKLETRNGESETSNFEFPVSSFQFRIPIIAVSANVFEQTRQESIKAGCDDFLVKPVHVDDLLERLYAHLKLEWIYDDTSEAQEIETPLEQEPIIPPPAEELVSLFELTLKGDIMSVPAQADRIERLDRKYAPFAAKVRQLAKTFQVDRFEKFIKQYIEDKK